MKDNPDHQMVAHHFCRQVNDDFAQCALFNGAGSDANLNGLECIISEKLFATLPAEERQYWHPVRSARPPTSCRSVRRGSPGRSITTPRPSPAWSSNATRRWATTRMRFASDGAIWRRSRTHKKASTRSRGNSRSGHPVAEQPRDECATARPRGISAPAARRTRGFLPCRPRSPTCG
jgi:hypothetical protein